MTARRDRFSLQRALVVAQIAVSLVLLVGALLFVRSFHRLMTFDPGMREEGVTAAFIGFQQSNIPPERYLQFQQQLVEEVRAMPGVLSAATTTNPPLVGGSWTHGIQIGSAHGDSKFTWVGPECFRTMGIPLLRGRGFSPSDTSGLGTRGGGQRDICPPVCRRRRSDWNGDAHLSGAGSSIDRLHHCRRDPGHQVQLPSLRHADVHKKSSGEIEIDPDDPDRRVQQAVRSVFERFAALGSARQVPMKLRSQGIQLPVHHPAPSGSKVECRAPVYLTILQVLVNPVFAGAYAFGNTESRTTVVNGRTKKTVGHRKPIEEWGVLIKGHHPGHVTWDQFERNQKNLSENNFMRTGSTRQ